MKRPTKSEVAETAKTRKGAINISIRKYLYLLQLTKAQVKKLHHNFLTIDYCGLCQYYLEVGKCPLNKHCTDPDSAGECIPEWARMSNAHHRLQNPESWTRPDEEYNTFLSNAAQIYIKLLKIKGTI